MTLPTMAALYINLSTTGHNSSDHGNNSIVKDDPVADLLMHETMTFFAILVMLCKTFLFSYFIFQFYSCVVLMKMFLCANYFL